MKLDPIRIPSCDAVIGGCSALKERQMLAIGPRPKYFPFCGDLCSPPGSSLPSHYSSSISLTFFTWKPGSDTSAEFLSLKKPLTHHWSSPFPFYLTLVFYLLSLQNYYYQKCSLQRLLFQSSAILNIVSLCRSIFWMC